jgi:hypothetical protein
MAYQLRCTVRGDGASGAYLDREHAEAALGSSELLRVASHEDDRFLGAVEFPPRQGMSRGMVMERWYQVTTAGPLIRQLMAEYHGTR